jgi:hypothetical protein
VANGDARAAEAAAAARPAGVGAQSWLDELAKWLGTPYVWGGDAPGGFDCSGLVNYSASQLGISIPRDTYGQWDFFQQHKLTVGLNALQPGDVLFFEPDAKGPGHEAVYIGNGEVIQAPHTGANVEVTPLNQMGGIVGAARVPGVNYEGEASLDASQLRSTAVQVSGQGAAGVAGGGAGTGATGGAIPGMTDPQVRALGQHVEQILGAGQMYHGPGAYKGFDIRGIPKDLQQETRAAIDKFSANPALEQQIFAQAYQNYGADLWMASDPQMRTLLVAGAINGWAMDPNMFLSLMQDTSWWKTHDANQRNFADLIHTQGGVNSASVRQLVNQASARITNIANQLGVQLTSQQLHSMAWHVASESASPQGQFSATAFSDQQIYRMVAGAFKASSFMSQLGQAGPGGTATSALPQGDAATLFNQFKAIAKNYYLPLSDSQIANKVQQYLRHDTGQGSMTTNAISGFTSWAWDQAKILYPALGSVLGTASQVGTDTTPYSALANYRSLIAQYTGYQGDPETINMLDPKWAWILTGKPPPNSVATPPPTTAGTSGAPATSTNAAAGGPKAAPTPVLPTYDQVQQYLMTRPEFQSTDLAKQMGWHVGDAIAKAFGFNG